MFGRIQSFCFTTVYNISNFTKFGDKKVLPRLVGFIQYVKESYRVTFL